MDPSDPPVSARGAWKILNVGKKGGIALFEFLRGIE